MNVVLDQVLDFHMAHQEVNIVQDSHKTVALSYGWHHNFLYKSDKHSLSTFQISFQMPLCDTILWIVEDMYSMLITDQINLYLAFPDCNRGQLVAS